MARDPSIYLYSLVEILIGLLGFHLRDDDDIFSVMQPAGAYKKLQISVD